MKKIAVILSGCGVFDGSEIHEAVLTLLAIDKLGASYEIFAPDIQQYHVINHLTGSVSDEKRNVLEESARIARGNISDLKTFNCKNFDGLVLPGGFGAAKNLSDYAFKGAEFNVIPDIEKAIISIHAASKPIAALCISPVILAKILGKVEITIGKDPGTISNIEQLGAVHKCTNNGQIIIDEVNKIVTSPCYMLNASVKDIADGAEAAIKALLEMTAD